MLNYKNLISILLLTTFIFSDQVENHYNGAIPSYTKIPKKGRINFEHHVGFTMLNQLFDSNGDLVSLLDEQKTNVIAYRGKFRYHGMHAAGVELILDGFVYTQETDDVRENFTTSTFGVYWNWNEMFTYKKPAFIPWQHGYTFSSTRHLTGLYFSRDYAYLKHSMDFILSPDMILSGYLKLTNDKVYGDDVNTLGSQLIYDINGDFSVAGGFDYSQSLFRISLSGGYQFKDISAGNLKMNFKLVPSVALMAGGKDTDALHIINLSLYTYFN